MQESWTRSNVFEALFKHGLVPDAALTAQVRALGVDLGLLEDRYPTELWRQVLAVTAAHLHPGLAPAAAQRQLGRDFLQGYTRTLLGKMLLVPVGLISTESMVMRTASYLNVDRPDIVARAKKTGPQQAEIEVQDPFPVPDFMCGVIEAVHARVAQPARVTLLQRREGGYTLGFDWS